MPDRFKGETPMQVHHCHDAPSGSVVLSVGTGGIKSHGTASSYSVKERLVRQPEQQYCCRLLFKIEQLTRLLSSLRLSSLRIPVETFTSPWFSVATIILYYILFVLSSGICLQFSTIFAIVMYCANLSPGCRGATICRFLFIF